MVLDYGLCNELSDFAVQKSCDQANIRLVKIIDFIWHHTSSTSKLRALFLDIFTSSPAAARSFKMRGKEFPDEFKDELISRFLRGENRDRFDQLISKSVICERYHVHSDNTKCEVKRP